MEKPDKSARVTIDANTKRTGSVDPKILKDIEQMTPAFFEALKKKEQEKAARKKK